MTLKNPYWTTGTLEGKAYIERDADQRLRKELLDNQRYVFLFGPRHGGTSSLITHCMDSLSPGQYCCTRVDLSKLPHSDYHTLIGALLDTIANDTALDKQEILTEFPEDTILAWLSTFPQRLILFLDEVQALGALPFRDQLFGKLRFLFNVRVENDQFSRLQVVLAGAAHPERLIPFNLATPFVGGAISLPLLTQKQVEKLTWDLETAQVQLDGQVASLLYQQTSGIVHLCQIILYDLWEEARRTRANIGPGDVERAIDRLIETAEQRSHFTTIHQLVTADAARLGAFLRFVKGDAIDPGVLQDLTLTGLCDPERPYLCPIYERVFGPNGTLDLGLARLRHSQITHRVSLDPRPSETTPQVHIEPPSEARREHSVVAPLPPPPLSGITPRVDVLPEPPLPLPRPLPGVPALEALPEPPRLPQPAQSALELPEPPLLGPSQATPPLHARPSNPPAAPKPEAAEAQALVEPPLLPPIAPTGDLAELDQAPEDDPTWVDDPIKQMSNQLAAARVAAEQPAANAASDPRAVEVRSRLEQKLMLSAELDSFCASFFPHVAQKFAAGMSRAEKTDLLLSLVAANEIAKRLREWSSRLELHQEVVSSVVSGTSSPPSGSEATPSGRSAKSPPRTAASPATEESVNAKLSAGSMQVGVGLVLANRYFLTSEVGQGPVAVVWNAYDRIKDEQVALKLIHGPAAEKPNVLETFWRSAQQMAALSHPAIVGVLNKPREESEIHYVVVEFLSGGNLRQWVQGGKLTRGQILRVLQRLGAGLQYAHERRVLHRNIKPTNILFDSTGHARLTDFNLVWPTETASSSEARADRLIFTAPEEQLGGGSGDPRADVYSLGMCALFALHGQELPSRVVQDRAGFIEHLDASPALKAVLRRATAASPTDRFSTAAEFCRALEFDSPALPGISVRNSLPNPTPWNDRSGPHESSAAPPSASSRPAPELPPAPPMPPPPIPSASQISAPPLPPAQVLPPPPMPVLAMPQELFSSLPPPAAAPAEPPPVRKERESGEIQPLPGRSPAALAEYRVETERVPAVAGTAVPANVLDAGAGMRRQPQRWQPYLFAGIAILAVAGGSVGYFFGAQKAGQPTSEPVSTTASSEAPANPPPAFSRPLRVEPLVPPSDTPPPPPSLPDKAAQNEPPKDPDKVPEKNPDKVPEKDPDKDKLAETALPANKPPAPFAVTQVAPAKPAVQEPVAPPPAPAAKTQVVAAGKPRPAPVSGVEPPALPPKPTAVAAVTPGKAKPTGQGSAPAKADAPQPKQSADAVAQRPKAAAQVAAPRPKVGPQQTKLAVAAPPKPAAAPPKPPAPPPKPPVAAGRPPAAAASQGPTAEGEAAIQAAQSAFVRGQHQQAISMAMQVTSRGGADALKAWRFVGGAACSVRSAQLATNAYNHLRDPEHRRLLIELCRRNGLQWSGSQFLNQDE